MACYHFTIKPDKRPDDTPIAATEHIDYINRDGKFKDIDDKEPSIELEKVNPASHADYINREAEFKKKGGCIYKDHHLPSWAQDSPKNFFSAAERFEGVGYSRYKEIEFALPNELALEQNKEIIDTFLEHHLRDFYYAYAIHDKDAVMGNGERNTHVHIMFSERKIDEFERQQERTREQFFARPFVPSKKNTEMTLENRGGCKKDPKWNGRGRARYLCEMRKDFALVQNAVLEKYGHSIRVDHRSLKAQREEALQRGDRKLAELLDRLPEKHLGPEVAAQKNHKAVIDLQKYRALKAEHRQLLFAADMLEAAIEKDEITKQITGNLEKTATLSKTAVYKAVSADSLRTLKTDVLHALKEVTALKNIVIWNGQATNMAREACLTVEERSIYDQLKKSQEERLHVKQLQKDLQKPPSWDH
ncbi:MAG: MobA/MobL family protein, partial [Phycisphaerales bacterium]